MSWQASVDELNKRRSMVARMGAPDKIERQHNAGKLTVRERITAQPGETLKIKPIPGSVHLFDATSGARIAA